MGLLFALAMGLVIAYVIHQKRQEARTWRRQPTLEAYLDINPECKTSRGIKCFSCGSGSIRSWGLQNAADARRTFSCNHCGLKLYRTS